MVAILFTEENECYGTRFRKAATAIIFFRDNFLFT